MAMPTGPTLYELSVYSQGRLRQMLPLPLGYDSALDPPLDALFRLPAPTPALGQFAMYWTVYPKPPRQVYKLADAKGIRCFRCHADFSMSIESAARNFFQHMASVHSDKSVDNLEEKETPASSAPSLQQQPAQQEQPPTPPTRKRQKVSAVTPTAEPKTPSTYLQRVHPNPVTENGSWLQGLAGQAGYWENAAWSDAHLEVKYPMAPVLLKEMLLAVPPCDRLQVLEVCAGNGLLSPRVLQAYPTATISLVESCAERMVLARHKLDAAQAGAGMRVRCFPPPTALSDDTHLGVAPVDLIVGCLSFRHLVEQSLARNPGTSFEETFALLVRAAWRSLRPGGHLVIADEVGSMTSFELLQALDKAGFCDVNVVWAQRAFFVGGGRKPPTLAAAEAA